MTLFSLDSLALEPAREDPTEAEATELRELVDRELRRLPKREREAVSAKAGLSGESCRTVARRYGTSPQTVCNWATAAIVKLRPKLEGCR
jgi:DNA-directed RNA polymerase specialized sigma24 family protein